MSDTILSAARASEIAKKKRQPELELFLNRVLQEAFVLIYPRAKEFLYSFDLSRFSVEQLLIKGRKSKGWAAKILEN